MLKTFIKLQKQIGIDKPLDGNKIDKKYKDFKDSSKKIFNVQWKNLKKLVMTLADSNISRIKVSCITQVSTFTLVQTSGLRENNPSTIQRSRKKGTKFYPEK